MSTSPAPSVPLIEIEDLHVTFHTKRRTVEAVRGLSLQINPGECVALVGESGSGKSVTARTLIGLAGPTARVDASQLLMEGRDMRRASDRRWRSVRGNRIGFVLQDALTSLDPLRTVRAEIAEALRHRYTSSRDRDAAVIDLLTRVGIPDPEIRARQHPFELSGGLRQRALIATALAADPPLIIADEPTTALDVTVQAQIIDLLASKKSDGTALLIVSHDLAVVSGIADRILVMHDGVVVEEGTTNEVLQHPQHPYTQTLLAAVPSAASRGGRLSPSAHCDTGPIGQPVANPPKQFVASWTSARGPVINARHLDKHFSAPGGWLRLAVRDVSLEVNQGEVVGIVGESGSGKSTLARLLLGLEVPDSGSVEIAGRNWQQARRNHEALWQHIQLVSQDPHGSFDPRFTAAELIAEPIRGRFDSQGVEARVRHVAQLVHLDEKLLAVNPRDLSGGQRQRVAIARALAPEPQVLVADEAVSALDVSIQAQILDLFVDLVHDTGIGLVFISHDLGVIHHIADRVVVMRDGVIVESGPVEEVFSSPAHPYTRRLLDAVPRLVTA